MISCKKDSSLSEPKSPMFIPVSTISFDPESAIFWAIFTVFLIVSLRLLPLAKGIVQKEQL